MELPLTNRPIGRDEALILFAHMEEMKMRLLSLHPDLESGMAVSTTPLGRGNSHSPFARGRSEETFSLLPGIYLSARLLNYVQC
eukprot:1198307-Rhodomonas_salina.2